MEKSTAKPVVQTYLTEDFLLPDMQVLDELDIFETAMPDEYAHMADSMGDDFEDWTQPQERPVWTKH